MSICEWIVCSVLTVRYGGFRSSGLVGSVGIVSLDHRLSSGQVSVECELPKTA